MWPLVGDHIAGTVVVSVAQVADALRLLHRTAGITAEGAGAATVAAAIAGRVDGVEGHHLAGGRVACIISGGNINPDVVARILAGSNA
jgi:threonine dehydratase